MCRWIVPGFALLYLLAVALLIVGTFGLFGQERDPLSGVFLMPLGLPWVLLVNGISDPLRPWAAGLAPLLNLVALMLLCRLLSGRAKRG